MEEEETGDWAMQDAGNMTGFEKQTGSPDGVIREVTGTEYLLLFGDYRTAFMDYAVSGACSPGGRVYMYFEEIYPKALLCLRQENDGMNMIYAFTAEERRGCGIFTALVRCAMQHTERTIRVNIAQDHRYYAPVRDALVKAGFVLESSCMVYSCEWKDYGKWLEYKREKGNDLIALLERYGFGCTSFARTDASLLQEIYDSGQNEFGNSLAVKDFFDDAGRRMDRDMSFAAVKDGHVAAYCLVSRPTAKRAVFEQISVARRYLGNGVILLPFAGAMDSMERFPCEKISYAMYENNVLSNAFRRKVLERVTSTRRRSENYIFSKKIRGYYGKPGTENL